MTSIKIPTPLRAYTGGQAEITVSGDTVAAVLEDLTGQFPELRSHLFNDGQLRDFVNIFIGDEDIRFRQGLETGVHSDDRLRIIPSIAGGLVVFVS
ncbi:MAG: MoaD/ThiS family protein [Chloroflexi bacterium]|nr:MoaD/ThiS family protein [Chloroflexota bacterium]